MGRVSIISIGDSSSITWKYTDSSNWVIIQHSCCISNSIGNGSFNLITTFVLTGSEVSNFKLTDFINKPSPKFK